MAVQCRRLLIKYVDKVVFMAFLGFFLVAAFKVVMKGPLSIPRVPPMSRKDFAVPEQLYKQRFVLNAIRNPQEPDATHDFTSDPDRIEPGAGEKQCPGCGWIVVRNLAQCPHCGHSWGPITIAGEQTSDPRLADEGVPFTVAQIERKPVDILFKGFTENPFKLRYDLQINWGGGKTTFVPLGDSFHGYVLYPLEKRVVRVSRPGLPLNNEERYFLTIKKPGEKALVVERGKTVRENEAFAILNLQDGMWRIRHRGEFIDSGDGSIEVYAGYMLEEVGGKGRKYEIAIVSDNEVVVKDAQGKETVLTA